jgi:metal-responsive CopG/Arc/MetJ family transcriptional regulator
MNKSLTVSITIDVESNLLETLRELANGDGAELSSLIDEALADLIAKRRSAAPRSHVMSAYLKSHENFAPLYQKLAK